jgi:hypothetical protein
MIDPRKVQEAFLDSLYPDEELTGTQIPPEGAVLVDGVMQKVGFHPDRLLKHKEEVSGWLKSLPEPFHKEGGGGWSFLEGCTEATGELWTGEQRIVDQLFCLGMGLGFVTCLVPRDLWIALPGGTPYYMVDMGEKNETA